LLTQFLLTIKKFVFLFVSLFLVVFVVGEGGRNWATTKYHHHYHHHAHHHHHSAEAAGQHF
jgi:hypothetical protein